MMKLASRVLSVKPSPTLAIDAKAKALQASGVDIVGFGAGEPDFDTPDHIKEAAITALKQGFTKYTPVGGIDELKEAIIDKFQHDNGLYYNKEEILVSCGAKHSLYLIAQSLFDKGDEVIVAAPYWVSYPEQIVLNDAKAVFIQTEMKDSFRVTPEMIKDAVTDKTRAFILNSPSNPTGFGFDRKTLEAIAEAALKYDFTIISDEIYEKMVYDNFQHISIASLDNEVKKRTIVVNGLSKSYSMTGWRIGYAAGDKSVIKAMTNIQSQSTSNPNSIAQKAAVAALRGPQDFLAKMAAAFDQRRKYIVERLNKIKGLQCIMPVGAFYVFPEISSLFGKKYGDNTIQSSYDLTSYLLEHAKVAVVPGGAFGDDRFIRLSYATSMDTIKKGVDRIEQAIDKLT
jgi:aspartate aminotransferase